MNDLIRRKDVQKHFPLISHHVLKRLAHLGQGPEYTIIGRDSLYRPVDIENYIESIKKTPNLEERRKRQVVSEILDGSPVRRPGRPKKKPTQPTAA